MVFTPIWDHSPFRWPTPPYVMWLLVVVNFAVFFYQAGGEPGQLDEINRVAGLIPAAFYRGEAVGGLWAPLTLVTYQFLHGNFMHVFGNMLFLFVFGDDIEEVFGPLEASWPFICSAA